MIKFVDLFCGLGGFRIALENACKRKNIKCECVFSCDIKPIAQKVYKNNFKESPCFDITLVDETQLPNFDILCAGFPCQPFSFSGKRLGFEDTRGTLFFEIARIIKEKQPQIFLLENVEGLVTHNKGKTLNTILDILKNELHYYVQYKLINAKDFSLPQSRNRLYIIGTKNQIEGNILKNTLFKDNMLLSHIIDKSDKNFLHNDFIDKLLSNFTYNELQGKSINDKRGGENNIHSWDIGLRGELTKLQKDICSCVLRERRKRYIPKEQGLLWRDGCGLTLEQILRLVNIDEKFLKANLNELVKLRYLKYEYPKENNNYLLEKEKTYDIPTGKLSFPITYILNKDDVSPTLTATDLSHMGLSLKDGIRKLNKNELRQLFGYPQHYNLDGISINDCYDLFGNTICINVVENIFYNYLSL